MEVKVCEIALNPSLVYVCGSVSEPLLEENLASNFIDILKQTLLTYDGVSGNRTRDPRGERRVHYVLLRYLLDVLLTDKFV